MKYTITPKQKTILGLIYDSIRSTGFAPTVADLKQEMHLASNQSILNFLNALEEKGCIKRREGQARGISIMPLGFKLLGKKRLIPVAGTSAAGAFLEPCMDAFMDWIPLPSKLFENESVERAQDDVFIVKVSGDSMVNAHIYDGDNLLIKRTGDIQSGDIVVARSEDGTTIKRFIEEGKEKYLKPENPAYSNIPINENTVFDGKVILNLSLIQ